MQGTVCVVHYMTTVATGNCCSLRVHPCKVSRSTNVVRVLPFGSCLRKPCQKMTRQDLILRILPSAVCRENYRITDAVKVVGQYVKASYSMCRSLASRRTRQ